MTEKLPIYFAPLQGFTEAPYRKAHQEVCGGADAYYAPFIRLERGEIRRKDLRDISAERCEGVRTIPQVIAADADEFEHLVRVVQEQGYRHVDLNMGCPFPMQTKAGRGAGLLSRPDAVKRIGDRMRMLQEEGLSFSVKMRLGWEDAEECLAIRDILNEIPLTYIAMHPRLGRQQYKGEVDFAACRQFMDGLTHPLFYNGDILSGEDAERVMNELPDVRGLLIGRGLLARPTLAAELKSGQMLPDEDVRRAVLQIHERVLADYSCVLEGGEAQVLQKMQPFWEYLESLFGHKSIKQIRKCRSLGDYKQIVAALD